MDDRTPGCNEIDESLSRKPHMIDDIGVFRTTIAVENPTRPGVTAAAA